MKAELHFISDAIPNGIAKGCGLWYYTHVLAYRVSFDTKYNIDQFSLFDNAWRRWESHGTLDETLRTMPGFAPFLTPAEVVTVWADVHIPAN